MKINWAYIKKPSVLIGAVILFFVLLFLLNRSGGASAATGSSQVVNAGPTDAQVAASTQLAMAQIGAGVQSQAIQIDYAKSQDANATGLAIAQIQAVLSGQSLQVQRDIATQTVAAQVHGLDLQYQTAIANNNFALDYAKNQFNYGIASQAISANTMTTIAGISANTQLQLSKDQLSAYGLGIAGQAISSANKGDRDQLTAQLIASMTGAGVNYEPGNVGSAYVAPSNNNVVVNVSGLH